MRILIADDDPDIAEVVAFGARMVWPDCEVVIAASGEEALRRFWECEPDLVVLDIHMPSPDGFQVLGRIRQSSQVPVLMVSVRDSPGDKARARALGVDGYLTKPFDHGELLGLLRDLR